MLVNPIQNTPLAYDPARHVLTPPAPVDQPQQAQPATAPIQQGDTPQDKFHPRSGGGGNQQDGGTSQQEKAANAEQLHDAWVRLQQLQQEANQALLAGDARGAKDAAQEAAQVAVAIQNITGSTPDVAFGSIELEANEISAHEATESELGTPQGSGGGTSDQPGQTGQPGQSGGAPIPGTVIDLARAGLGTANQVVDTAASIPSQPAGDLASIYGYKQTVLKAIAGVEAIAARVLGINVGNAGGTSQIDIRA